MTEFRRQRADERQRMRRKAKGGRGPGMADLMPAAAPPSIIARLIQSAVIDPVQRMLKRPARAWAPGKGAR